MYFSILSKFAFISAQIAGMHCCILKPTIKILWSYKIGRFILYLWWAIAEIPVNSPHFKFGFGKR